MVEVNRTRSEVGRNESHHSERKPRSKQEGEASARAGGRLFASPADRIQFIEGVARFGMRPRGS